MRRLLFLAALLLPLSLLTAYVMADDGRPTVTVYKSPTCGCCSKWVAHLEENGFDVKTTDVTDLTAIKVKFDVPGKLQSCHTAVVDGYVVEGHVPADVVKRLLEEKPDVAGIAVPGMPIGSPGMEVAGRPAEPYDVVAFGKGEQQVYEHIN